MKKILFLIFDLGHGGAEKVLVQLVNSLDSKKYDITVQTIFNVGVNKNDFLPHIHRKWLFSKQFHGMKYLIRFFSPRFLHKILIKENYDYEIAYLEGIPTRVISGCQDKHTKTFAWVHIQMDSAKDFFNTYWSVSEAEQCYRKFHKIAFVSEIAKTSFQEKTGWKWLDGSIVHNTLDVENLKQLSNEPIDLKLSSEAINLCSVGRLTKQKGYSRLMYAFKKLINKGITDWHFYLLGEGELREELTEIIEQEGLKEYISLLGYDVNPYKYVSKMDWFVCSSYKEGYSTAVTESVIVGTPVVTTDCAGMREILGEEAGIIVDNSDTALISILEQVLTDKTLIPKYKKGAIQQSYNFTKEKTLKEFEDFILS